MSTRKDLKDLIELIKQAKGWTQERISVEAGYEPKSLTQALSKKSGYEPVIKKLKIVFKDVLESPTYTESLVVPEKEIKVSQQEIINNMFYMQAKINVSSRILIKFLSDYHKKDIQEETDVFNGRVETEFSRLIAEKRK